MNKLMNLIKLRKIAQRIYDICFDAERNIAGLPEVDAILWAKTDSLRHAHTITSILDYATKTNKDDLNILNASGAGCGHQDFSITSFLRKNTSVNVRWKVFDSPNNACVKNDLFTQYLNKLDIELELSDFSQEQQLYGTEAQIYDVVIFTEIAEHLDHTAFLKALIAIRNRMRPDGILIVTTPNLVRLTSRIKFLFGRGDVFWGDATQRLREGVYGHIVNYDIWRLNRLLGDVGYKITQTYSFTAGHGSSAKGFLRGLLYGLVDIISFLFRYLQATLFVVAVNSDNSVEA